MTTKDFQPHLTRGFQFALDVTMLVLAFAFAYLLRFEFAVPEDELHNALQQLPYVVLVQLAALALAGVYSFIWRYVGLGEVKAFVYAAVWSALVLGVLRLSLPSSLGNWRVPLSVTLMDTVLAFGGVLGLRVVRRYVYEKGQRSAGGSPRRGPPSSCRRSSSAPAGPGCSRRGRSRGAAT